MDIFNVAKAIEKLIFEFVMWLIFYPYTLFRVIFQPGYMIAYAARETERNEDVSFDSGMKPAIFLFLSIVLAAVLAPVQQSELAELGDTQAGQYVIQSWFNLLFFRMVIYSIFPIVFALVFDLLRPGGVTRNSLRLPFNQQCYICAPFALVTSSSIILYGRTDNPVFLVALIAAQLWLLGANVFFYKTQLQKSALAAFGLALVTFIAAWVLFLTLTTLVLRFKGMS